jgi:hypothetical protein
MWCRSASIACLQGLKPGQYPSSLIQWDSHEPPQVRDHWTHE